MCGIIGYTALGPVPEQAHEAVRRMLIATQARGRDATGFACMTSQNKIAVHKEATEAKTFVAGKEFRDLSRNMPKMFLGHCRLATQGSVKNNDNNHPIYDKKFGWAVIHNGVISNDDRLFKEYKLPRQAQVDSEIILRLFQKFMLEDLKMKPMNALKKTVAEISGSLTFAMIGEEYPDTLYLYKSSNPLVLVYVEKWGMIFFGSKLDHIEFGLRSVETRCNGFFARSKKIVDYWVSDEVDENTAIRIGINNGSFTVNAVTAEKKKIYFRNQSTVDDVGQHRMDLGSRYGVGRGYWESPDGSVISDHDLTYDKDKEIGDMSQ